MVKTIIIIALGVAVLVGALLVVLTELLQTPLRLLGSLIAALFKPIIRLFKGGKKGEDKPKAESKKKAKPSVEEVGVPAAAPAAA